MYKPDGRSIMSADSQSNNDDAKRPRRKRVRFMMGYDTDRFTEPVNEALTCCICRDVLEDPVQAPCEHAYCSICIEGWLVHETSCPEDRRPLSMSDLRPLFRYMRNDLNSLQIRCKNRDYGCDLVTSVELIHAHERDCAFEMFKCPNERCMTFISRRELTDHLRMCAYNQVECPNGCGLVISQPSDENHNCIQELRTAIEVLRSEMTCKYEERKQEMDLRLDMQRGHMVQKESMLQSQIDALKSENSKLEQNMKLLMDMELKRRQDTERLKLEKKELMELLRGKNIRAEVTSRRLQLKETLSGKVTTI